MSQITNNELDDAVAALGGVTETAPEAKEPAAATTDTEEGEENTENTTTDKKLDESDSDLLDTVLVATDAKKKEDEKPKVEDKKKDEEPKVEDKKTEKNPEDDKKDELAELEAQINQPHVKPKSKELFAKVKETAEKYKEEATKLRQEVEALKKTPLPPEIEKELTEYREIVNSHYAERSTEVKNKFDTPISDAKSNLEKQLIAVGWDDDKSKAAIAKLLTATSLSDPLVVKNIKVLQDAELYEEAELIKDTIKQVATLTKQRSDFITSQKTNFTEKQKQAEAAAKLEEDTARANGTKEAAEEVEAIKKAEKWISPLKIDPNDPEDVRKNKEAHNKAIESYVKDANEFFGKLAEGKYNAKELVRMAFNMVESKHYKKELESANAKVAKLNARLEEYKKTGKASNANVSIGKNKVSKKEPETLEDAIDSFLAPSAE